MACQFSTTKTVKTILCSLTIYLISVRNKPPHRTPLKPLFTAINQTDPKYQPTGTSKTSKTAPGLKTYLKSSKRAGLKDLFSSPLAKKQKNEVESSNHQYFI